MRRTWKYGRLMAGAAAATLLAVPSEAYYQFVHFNRNALGTPIYEKFDLNALSNKTLRFFVSDQGPTTLAANDSYGSILTQVKQAAEAWNGIASSDLRVEFGGTADPNQAAAATPFGQVVFADLGPGVIGYGGVTTSTTPVSGPDGAFFPAISSTVKLSRDTNVNPSYLEAFFTTAVHELGHALGLQHTWTGSAMSQAVVRNTSRTRPLDADDIAGLSVLYGKPGWVAGFGSIAGKVTFANGTPAALASVVALSPTGPAVSTLTNPDGTYVIQGVPPNGNYLVYVHPLPPDAVGDGEGVRLPVDEKMQPLAASAPFGTVFFQGQNGTLDPRQAQIIPGSAGLNIAGVNFSVQSRAAVPTFDVVTYSELNPATRNYVLASSDNTVYPTPAVINTTQAAAVVLARAYAPASLPVPQSVTILGGFATAVLNPADGHWPLVWSIGPSYVGAVFMVPLGAGVGPRHLVFNFGNDMYVLPGGVNLVQKGPPEIASVTPNDDGTVTVAGAGLTADSSVYFNGLKVATAGPGFTGDDVQGSITVTPPQGSGGLAATVIVYNNDGQNSTFLPDALPTYTYPAADAGQIASSSVGTTGQKALPAGSTAWIDVTTTGTNFVDGQVAVGFGSSDITVRRVWVLSPTELAVNVEVAANATATGTEVSVLSGFQSIVSPGGFQIVAAQQGLPAIALPPANADTTQKTIYPGAGVVITVQNLGTSSTGTQVTLNDAVVPSQVISPTQVKFAVPGSFPLGPARLSVNNGTTTSYGVMMQIDKLPPMIVGVTNQAGQSVLTNPAGQGDIVSLYVTGLDPDAVNNWNRVQVTVGGVTMPVQQVATAANGQITVQFQLTQPFNGSAVPVAVVLDGTPSPAVTITFR